MSYLTYATINSLEEFGFIAGTDYLITFNVFEENGITPLDMGGATIKWLLAPYGQTSYNVLQINGVITGVGVFTVTVPSASTETFSGKYIHQVIITSFAGSEYRPGQGVLLISPRIAAPSLEPSYSITGTTAGLIAETIHAAPTKVTPVDADEIPLWNSVGSVLANVNWANLKATLKTYFDVLYAGVINTLVYKGVIDCSTNPNYPAADAGHVYVISVAGKIGGASGVSVDAGDIAICNTDGTVSGTQAAVGAYWNIVEKNIAGAVTGPASATDGNLALFDGVTGKIIKLGSPPPTNEAGAASNFLTAYNSSTGAFSKAQFVIPGQFERVTRVTGGASGAETTLIITPASETMNINVDGNLRIVPASTSLDVDVEASWIATTYATPANRAGKDFKIYAIENGGALAPTIQCDLAATAAPANSRLIGGFHCLAVAVGTISGHTLTTYAVGDILPQSVWDLKWCPRRRPDGTYQGGMVYSSAANIWVDIYLMSGTGASTASVNGGTISDTRNWMDFVDDAGAVGKRLLRDREFQLVAAGCNEGTNITGSADPTTTGGHTDTAGRRMISNIGCEDMAGVMWQWLDEQLYQVIVDAPATFAWVNQTGGKGQLYLQGATADVKLLAGGAWNDGTSCGSRGRYASISRWVTSTALGGRAGVEPE